jgi:hypothetical protein
MPDAPELLAYPLLWRRSRELCPDNWKDQFRVLCQLAHDFRRDHRAEVLACGEGEQMFLESLALCDREDLISSMIEWADPGEINPLRRFDPDDPSPAPARVRMNGHKVFDA